MASYILLNFVSQTVVIKQVDEETQLENANRYMCFFLRTINFYIFTKTFPPDWMNVMLNKIIKSCSTCMLEIYSKKGNLQNSKTTMSLYHTTCIILNNLHVSQQLNSFFKCWTNSLFLLYSYMYFRGIKSSAFEWL